MFETEEEARAECKRLNRELFARRTLEEERLSLKYEYESC